MFCGCCKRPSLTHKFTVLQVHVVGATNREALKDSNLFALKIVQDFFRKYTKIEPRRVAEFAYNFEHLAIDSRLEIAFEGKPKGFDAPSYKVLQTKHRQGLLYSTSKPDLLRGTSHRVTSITT
jgi:hypothetical protein